MVEIENIGCLLVYDVWIMRIMYDGFWCVAFEHKELSFEDTESLICEDSVSECDVTFLIKFTLSVSHKHRMYLAASIVPTPTTPDTSVSVFPHLVARILEAVARLQGELLFEAVDTITMYSVRGDTPVLRLLLTTLELSCTVTPQAAYALVVLYHGQASLEFQQADYEVRSGRNGALVGETLIKLIRDGRVSFVQLRSCFTHPVFVRTRYSKLFVSSVAKYDWSAFDSCYAFVRLLFSNHIFTWAHDLLLLLFYHIEELAFQIEVRVVM